MHYNSLWKLLVVYVIYPSRNSVTSTNLYTNEYSWRDFEGALPDDSLKAGQDARGNPIYIGQALHENSLVPGKIYTNDPKVYIEWHLKERAYSKNVKILCTTQPQKFEWIATELNKVGHLTNTIVIKGGYEKDFSTYIGRAFVAGETLVGKVICGADDCLGFYVTSGGVGKNLRVFEILTFNPSTPTIDYLNCNGTLFFGNK